MGRSVSLTKETDAIIYKYDYSSDLRVHFAIESKLN